MSKHTPGPWTVHHIDGEKFRIVDSMDMAELSNIATVHFHDDEVDETKANARLIAAAPELLEALKELAEVGAEAWGGARPCVSYAFRVIAKATGEQA